MTDLPDLIEVQVREECPPDTVYMIDAGVLDVDEPPGKKIVVCPTEKLAEDIRRAMRGGWIDAKHEQVLRAIAAVRGLM